MMKRKTLLWLVPIAGIVFLTSCGGQKPEDPIRAIKLSEEPKRKPMIAELQRLYVAAKSEQERRAICLQAIDDGVLRRGIPVESVDQIFGTELDTKRAAREIDGMWVGAVRFLPDVDAPLPTRSDDRAEARGSFGWFLTVDYDDSGVVQKYYLSNLHKGLSSRADGEEPISVVELKRLYDAAKSELERRDVALQAIDEGVIQTFGPVNISTVDSIFGSHLASQLPTRNQVKRTGIVDFTLATPTAASEKDEAGGSNGWLMAVEYYYDGNIANYYLTNVRP